MLMGFLDDPNDFFNHIRRYTTSLTTQMDFGFRMKTMEDPRAKQMFDVRSRVGLARRRPTRY